MSSFASQSGTVMWVVAAMFVALATGTVVRLRAMRGSTPPDLAQTRLDSLRSWWLVAGIVATAALFGVTIACIVFTGVSLLALIEFFRISLAPVPSGVRRLTLAIVPASYLLLGLGLEQAFLSFVPIAAVAVLGSAMVFEQQTNQFLDVAAKNLWGLAVTTFMLGHVILLFTLPTMETAATGAGWFLLLVMLTEGSDITQALVGRRIGRRKLAPIVSPHKTWEGFLGGVAITALVATLLGPSLTPLTVWQSLLGGLIVSVTGLLGDLNISALKRDAGVKDSGTLLPGQGGVLDRIDSLSFTAPAFYYFSKMMVG